MFLETIFTGILFVESFWLLLKWHYSPHKTFKAELVVDGKNEFGNDAIKSIHVTWQCKTSWILMRTMKLLQGKNAHLDFGKSFNVAIVVNGQLFLLSDQYLMSIEKGFSPLFSIFNGFDLGYYLFIQASEAFSGLQRDKNVFWMNFARCHEMW